MYEFTISGNPVPWKSHGGYGKRSFSPRYKEREFYRWTIKQQMSGLSKISGAIALRVIYHITIPGSYSIKKKRAILSGQIYPIKRPDLTNYNKFLEDCLTGLVWEDDSQIVRIEASKQYSSETKTVIFVNILS